MKVLSFAILLATTIAQAENVPASEAKQHLGENATVCGVVSSEHTASSSKGQPTFINLDAPYPRQVFTVLVWSDDRVNVGALPALNAHLCATGLIKDYRGVPEIIVKTKDQLSR